ncbi:MAG: hypothetical protein HUU15_06145 [Candidatus Brocadiae bacterium]|nr:hypothetical protein [Candidatus Brocadiia bacterium]
MRLPIALMAAVLVLGGCDGKKPAQDPPPAPAGGGAGDPPAVPKPVDTGWKASLEGLTPPASPARGMIRGSAFAFESGTLEDGRLQLRQGKDFFADRELSIFLFLKNEGEVPAGRSWSIKSSKEYNQPHVHIASRQGDELPDTDMFMNEYSMLLTLGEFRDGTISGSIWICLPDEKKSWVAGAFTARVKGFIMGPDGPDRTQDSLKLLQWLAKEHVEKANPGQTVKQEESRDSMCGVSDDPKAELDGIVMVKFRIGSAAPAWNRFRFHRKGEWRVVGVLPPHQFPEAHPIQPHAPGSQEEAEGLAAAAVEAELAGAPVFGAMVQGQGRDTWCLVRVQYSTSEDSSGDASERRFLYRKNGAAWALDRELREGEEIDYRSGAIKPAK